MTTIHVDEETAAALSGIQQRLLEQDNLQTRDPVFHVQVKDFHLCPLDQGGEICFQVNEPYSDSYIVLKEFDQDEWERWMQLAQSSDLPSHVKQCAYQSYWKTVQTCFSAEGCEDHLELNRHNYRPYLATRIYCDAIQKNPEMLALRDFLLNFKTEE